VCVTMWGLITMVIYLWLIGVLGLVLNQRNLLTILLSLELMLLSLNLGWGTWSVYLDDVHGQWWILLILVVAAGETAIGLGLLVAYYRVKGGIGIWYLNQLKG